MDDQGGIVSRVVRSSPSSRSLRLTIPQVIASTLGLDAGDDLVWRVEPGGGSARVLRRPSTPASAEAWVAGRSR